MGKKSLLSSTSRRKSSSESGEQKDKKSGPAAGTTKKVTKTAPGKKILAGAAVKKQASPKKKAVSKTATAAKASADPAPEKIPENMALPPLPAPPEDDYGIGEYIPSSMEPEDALPVKKMNPMQKAALFGILFLIVLLALVVSASFSNTEKYYLRPVNGKLEIWKGSFSPMGKKKFVALGATPMPAEPKAVYDKNEIFPFIFESYVNLADALLNASDIPDFEHIKRTLNKASVYAVSPELKKQIRRRFSKIDLMALVYKADILADKDTLADLASARDALEKAMRLDLDEAERGLLSQKLQWIDERKAQLERK